MRSLWRQVAPVDIATRLSAIIRKGGSSYNNQKDDGRSQDAAREGCCHSLHCPWRSTLCVRRCSDRAVTLRILSRNDAGEDDCTRSVVHDGRTCLKILAWRKVRFKIVLFWSFCWDNEKLHLLKSDSRLSLHPTPCYSHAPNQRNIMPLLNCKYASIQRLSILRVMFVTAFYISSLTHFYLSHYWSLDLCNMIRQS